MTYDIKGELFEIRKTDNITEKFSKKDFSLKMQNGKYDSHILFTCINRDMALLDDFSVGDIVRVSFQIMGKLKNNKYYNTLKAVQIEKIHNV